MGVATRAVYGGMGGGYGGTGGNGGEEPWEAYDPPVNTNQGQSWYNGHDGRYDLRLIREEEILPPDDAPLQDKDWLLADKWQVEFCREPPFPGGEGWVLQEAYREGEVVFQGPTEAGNCQIVEVVLKRQHLCVSGVIGRAGADPFNSSGIVRPFMEPCTRRTR